MELSNPIIDEQSTLMPDMAIKSAQVTENQDSTPRTQETGEPAAMSDREFKMAYIRAVKERKDKLKQNREMISDMNLEVDYWKAQSDLLKYRFEKMDYYLKNLDLEPVYLRAIEAQNLKESQNSEHTSSAPTSILD